MPLIGIDPDATETLILEGATFTLGTIPAGAWQRIRWGIAKAYERASRRAIAALSAEGVDPEEVAIPVATTGARAVTRANLWVATDGDLKAELLPWYVEAARWAVRSWEGFQRPNREAIPCSFVETKLEGETFKVLAPESLRWVRQLYPLASAIFVRAQAMSEVSAEEKKD